MEKKQTVVALLQGSYYLSYFEHFEQKNCFTGEVYFSSNVVIQNRARYEITAQNRFSVLLYSRYVEKEHSQYCVPSNISSGLATLPLDYVYIHGKKTSQKTSKRLPTGEKLNGKTTYLKLLQYFTTTEKTPDEIYRLGWSIINRSYPEVRN